MILDLTNVPFTRRNSYMVISYITDQFRLFGRKIAEDEGLYLRRLPHESSDRTSGSYLSGKGC